MNGLNSLTIKNKGKEKKNKRKFEFLSKQQAGHTMKDRNISIKDSLKIPTFKYDK